MTATLLGIDVGTTGAKALLIAEDGGILASASESYPLITPGIGLCEQRAEDWWNAVVRIVRRVCDAPERARSVRGISLSTQGGTVVPTDASFNPLANAIVWSDVRCAQDQATFDATLGEGYVYRASGWSLIGGLPALQLRRMRLTQPELFRRAAWFLTVPDFIAAKLTGRPVLDLSNAGINQLIDIRRGRYDPRILDFIGVGEERLGALAPSGSPIGTLTHDAAAALGLDPSVQVCAGAHDQYAVALGVGICESGDAVIGTGTAWVVTALRDAPDFDSGLAQSVPAVPDRWGAMLSISTGGVCLDWFRRQVACADGAPLDYGALNDMVAQRDEPGAGGLFFYPFFNGAGQPIMDPKCKAALVGLDLSHDRGHIARAVMEGVSCQIVWGLRTLERFQTVDRLFVTGGATKSAVWSQMLSEIADRPLHVSETPDEACVGAAMMAAAGCGLFSGTVEAARHMVSGRRVVEPDPRRARAYQEVFERYRRGARSLQGLYAEL